MGVITSHLTSGEACLVLPKPHSVQGTLPRWSWPEWFLIAQTALPAMLFLPGTQSFRFELRLGPFLLGFVALVYLLNRVKNSVPHTSLSLLFIALSTMVCMFLHPGTAPKAGIAQVGLYASVMVPVFWVPVVVAGPRHLNRLLWIMLVCNGVNAFVGVLQVYDPDRWLPSEFSQLAVDAYGGSVLSYVNDAGSRIIRPPGLFDTPGAACGPGGVAAVLGLMFGVTPTLRLRHRLIALAFSFIGIGVIYLSHVRANLVVVLICAVAFGAVLLCQGRFRNGIGFFTFLGSVLLGALTFAVLLGGEVTRERFLALLERDPMEIYAQSRGGALEQAFEQLVYQYPFGAGLGRWGMVSHYFSSRGYGSAPLFAEIQPAGWILDGGVLLLAVYGCALLAAAMFEFDVAVNNRSWHLRHLAAIVFSLNLGTIAFCFSFVPFVSQVGIQYWFLTAALHGAVCYERRQQREAKQ